MPSGCIRLSCAPVIGSVPVLDEVVDNPALQLERHHLEQKNADL
jgi:hypothetical protein